MATQKNHRSLVPPVPLCKNQQPMAMNEGQSSQHPVERDSGGDGHAEDPEARR